jgi:NAD(P)-dependent dehydrogenase (short-subunit alcohol dehydrogenase family)
VKGFNRYDRIMEINGRSALVTGGAVRLGETISRTLAAHGANVFIHYNRSSGPAEDLKHELEGLGGTVAVGAGDLSDPATARDLIDDATSALGPISILVNSASGFPTDTVADITVDQWRDTADLTLGSPLFLTQAFADALPSDMSGAIVNLTDVKTITPYRKHLSYMLAKGGIDTLTRATALSLAPRIRVNALALGVILPPPGEGEEYLNALAAELPLERSGGSQVVADAVAFLASNDFITGEIIRLDGGEHLG